MPPEEYQPKPMTEEQKNLIKRVLLLLIGWFFILSGTVQVVGFIIALVQKLGSLNVGTVIFTIVWIGLGIFLVDKSKTFKSAKKTKRSKRISS